MPLQGAAQGTAVSGVRALGWPAGAAARCRLQVLL